MDTRKFILLISALTAVVCALTVVYNFASMPAYGDEEVSAVALYSSPENSAISSDYSSSAVSKPSNASVSASAAISTKTSSARQPVKPAAKVSSVSYAATTSSSAVSKTSKRSKRKSKSRSGKTATEANPVNLNSATAAQLETVPFIGESRANAIIAYRSAHGAFKNINGLDAVKGFGKKMIAKVSPYLTTTT